MKILATFLCVSTVAVLVTGCASRLPDLRTYQDPRVTKQYKDLLASGAMIDFDGCPSMMFKLGHPKTKSEGLLDALHPDTRDNFKQQFFDCLGLMARTPQIKVEINGFSDPAECTTDCQDLSLRRAIIVRDALLEMHFPKEQIACVAGQGTGYELDINGLNPAMNRRVELWPGGQGCKV